MAWPQWQDWSPSSLLRSLTPAAPPRVTPRAAPRVSAQAPESRPLCFGAAVSAVASSSASLDAKARDSGQVELHSGRQASTSSVLLGLATGRVASSVAVMAALADTSDEAHRGEYARTLLSACEQLAIAQLCPTAVAATSENASLDQKPTGRAYGGPIALLKEAYAASLDIDRETQRALSESVASSAGFPAIALALLDNSSQIHGQPHPMVAMLSISGHRLLMLRREERAAGNWKAIFRPSTSRDEGCEAAEDALEWGCVTKGRIAVAEAIEKASRVHCVSARQGDLVILSEASAFQTLTVDEVVTICNDVLPVAYGPGFVRTTEERLQELVDRLAGEEPLPNGSALVVAEVVEHAPTVAAAQDAKESSHCAESRASPACKPVPIIEGVEDSVRLQCGMALGDWQMSFYAQMPKGTTAAPGPPSPPRISAESARNCNTPIESIERNGSARSTGSTAAEKNRQSVSCGGAAHGAASRSTRHTWLGA